MDGLVGRWIGSSPRVRGTADRTHESDFGGRFIPACAGNSRRQTAPRLPTAVHPRVCGEQHMPEAGSWQTAGSSPRVRGTADEILQGVRLRRFIPACAGNRRVNVCAFASTSVHPRVCGEQYRCRIRSLDCRGSSPRVRGTAKNSDTRTGRCRFIPACAGNSFRRSPGKFRGSVHPRVCGEQFLANEFFYHIVIT